MSGALGKLLGINQDKAVDALSDEVKELLGGLTIAEFIEQYGDTHQLGFNLSIVDSEVRCKVRLEPKEKP